MEFTRGSILKIFGPISILTVLILVYLTSLSSWWVLGITVLVAIVVPQSIIHLHPRIDA